MRKPALQYYPCQRANVAYILLSTAKSAVRRRVVRSRGEAEVFRFVSNDAGEMRGKKYGAAVTSRHAGQELDLICNHKFV